MSNYTPSTDFAAKDSLLSGNPNKIVKGTEITAELTSIAAAVATKADSNSSNAFQAGATTLGATTATSLNSTPIGNSTPSTGAFTTLSASSTVSGAGFTARFASPGPIGSTTPSTGAFTTLSASGNITGQSELQLNAVNAAIRLQTSGSNKWAFINDFPSAGQMTVYDHAAAVNRAVFSSTGLSVTGALSATTTGADNTLRITRTSFADAVVYAGGTNASFGTVNNYPVTVIVNNSNVATFDSSGNLGLGVTPSAWDTTQKAIQLGNGASLFAATSAPTAQIGANTYYNAGYKYVVTEAASRYLQYQGSHAWFTAPSGTAGNAITFTQAMTLDASGNLNLGNGKYIGFGNNDTLIYGDSSTNILYLRTNATERARIDSSGNLLVGVNSGSSHILSKSVSGGYAAAVYNQNATNPLGFNIYYASAAPNSTGAQFLVCNDTGAVRAEIRSNGGLANFSANNVNLSDERLKKDFAPATSYYEKMKAVEVVTFLYKDQTDTELNLGVRAQQLDAVAPELIDHSGFGEAPEGESPYLAVYQTDLQYAILKALQETMAKLEAAEARIAALEAK